MNRYQLLSILMFVSAQLPAQTILYTDFNAGIPDTFSCIDGDGLQPAPNMEKKGFAKGDAWIAVIDGDFGKAACSTSYYSPKGQADDWMITPPVKLDIADAELRWSAKANNSKYRDGYTVLLSTASDRPDDFTTALFSTDAEENSWQTHSVDLSRFAGQTIRIAFVNNSNNKECLLVDDIYIGSACPVMCTLDVPAVTPIGGQMSVNAVITNTGDAAIDRTEIDIDFDGHKSHYVADMTVGPGKTVKYQLPENLYIPFHKRAEYSVSAKAGGKSFSYVGSVFSYPRRVLAEEGTATTCSWCIRGIVMMDRMEEKYPDRFVSMSLHKGDVMSVEGYEENINKINDNILMLSIPNTVVNRKVMCDPINIDVNFRTGFNQEKVLVAMEADAVYDKAANKAAVTSRLHFAEKGTDTSYRLAYYLVEDSVYHPGNIAYNQANAYAGDSGDWNGYENMDAVITDMRFRNVVRGYDGLFDGVPESVPSSFDADCELTHDYLFPIPDNVDKIEKCHFVVMLIDMSDRHVVNVCTAPVRTTPSGIRDVVTESVSGPEIADIFSVDGRLVARGADPTVLMEGLQGVFIVKKGMKVEKVLLRR